MLEQGEINPAGEKEAGTGVRATRSSARHAQSAPKGRRYWRNMDELQGTPEFRKFVEREFPASASELLDSSRRGFLKLMGASLALAGLSGCLRWPEEKLAPYAHRPANRSEGVPVNYATAMEIGGIGQGLLVESYDGRPTKIEGNPTHPLNMGTADIFAQASVLDVYDPDRRQGVLKNIGLHRGSPPRVDGDVATWAEFLEAAKKDIPADGAGFAILSEASGSPSIAAMRKRLMEKMPKTQWFEYESASEDNVREGVRLTFGMPLKPVLALDAAKVIVTLDADIFDPGNPMAIKYARDFATGRRLHDDQAKGEKEMNRLYCVEPVYTNTGTCADHRRALPASKVVRLVNEIAAALNIFTLSKEAGGSGVDAAFTEALVADLKANSGACVLVAGPRQPVVVHALVAQINATLDAIGKTVKYYADPDPTRQSHAVALKDLADKMNGKQITALLILGGNPVYDAPADVDFAKALANVKTSMHLAIHLDETSQGCTWHLSRAHPLEAWGDVRTFDGTVSIVQPLIEPLFDGKSVIEVLAMLAGDEKIATQEGGFDIVRGTVKELLGAGYTEWKWKQSLFDGVVAGTAAAEFDVKGHAPHDSLNWQGGALAGKDVPAGPYELALSTDRKVYDGRFGNNGWLQELPDPMTRLTWDNAALVSPNTADAMGVTDDDVVTLTAGNVLVRVPIYVMPGVAEGTIGLTLGYGRWFDGAIADGVGANAYPLRSMAVAATGWCGVSVAKTGDSYELATVQQHHMVDAIGNKGMQQRIPELVRERTLKELNEDVAVGNRKIMALSIFDEHKFDGRVDGWETNRDNNNQLPSHDFHKWGMAIDLTLCTGCSACVTACQAENNIPIVGKEQVLHGREMHWIRIDRYFRNKGEEIDPAKLGSNDVVAVHQPVTCMHCENAPCEEVCPVAATTHSQEGINMMTYNRCIGTRYCSNNCPYKVRRFNFFDYNRGKLKNLYTPNILRDEIDELTRMQKNPDVTVRMRGIMEKCTYCVQRVEETRIKAKREGDRAIAEGEIVTACQQSCPTQAIVFGDLNLDGKEGRSESRVHKWHELARTYGMLDADLNTRPRTQYVTRIRNPHGELDKAEYAVEAE